MGPGQRERGKVVSRRSGLNTHSGDYGLKDKTAGQPFCAAAELPAGRGTGMYLV
jgi:hypothetical protein